LKHRNKIVFLVHDSAVETVVNHNIMLLLEQNLRGILGPIYIWWHDSC